MTKIAIVGGGAAGIMVAATLLERDDREGEILLFEKNSKLGAKVIISGGGRCNLTTGIFKRKELEKYYTRGWGFLENSIKKFGPRAVKKWFEAHGVPCKEEQDKRIFPESNKGEDVVRVFERIFNTGNIAIHFSEGVKNIELKGSEMFQVATEKGKYIVDKVVITTGGNAFAHTGSSGDGYAFARSLGHTITPLGPSLNSFMTREKRLHTLSGLSFQDATLKAILSDGKRVSSSGSVLLTHFGISGPNTFVLASESAFEIINNDKPFRVLLQPIRLLNTENWSKILLTASHDSPKKELQTVLGKYLTRRFVEALLAELNIRFHLKMSDLRKKDRQILSVSLGEGIPLNLVKRRPGDEFVTAGGVNTSEIDPKTLESIVCPGLSFAGEIVNVDGVTGGFNLQACWAMGRNVGMGIE